MAGRGISRIPRGARQKWSMYEYSLRAFAGGDRALQRERARAFLGAVPDFPERWPLARALHFYELPPGVVDTLDMVAAIGRARVSGPG